MARRNLCSITDVKKIKGCGVLGEFSVLITAVEQNSCSVDANFNVLLMGKCLDQLLGMPASRLHMQLARLQLGEDAIIQALSSKLVGQCAMVTLDNYSLQHMKSTEAPRSGANLPLFLLTGIQVVGDGCETLLSYPPFCHHALTPPVMSSKQVVNQHASSLLSFSSPTSQGPATPLHCQHDRTTPLPSYSLSPWDSVQHDRTTPLPSYSLSPWDSVQHDSTARPIPIPTYNLSPLDSAKRATIETPGHLPVPDRDVTDSSLCGSPELFVATPFISRQRGLPKKMLVHPQAKADILTPDIL